jgi:tetratricopeptide (TPR) repeat protein/predicted aspartyl protease
MRVAVHSGAAAKVALAACLALPWAGAAAASCVVHTFAELPVTMVGLTPLVPGRINGADGRFLADSGAFFSLMSPANAAGFGLKLTPAPFNLTVRGLGGEAQLQIARVKQFTLAGIPLQNVDFLVGGSEIGGASGMIGQNILNLADVEYDLASGVIRLMKPEDCGRRPLAYWASSQPYSVMDIKPMEGAQRQTRGEVFVNGRRVEALFDTGASLSILSIAVAKRIGLDVEAAVPADYFHGVGRRPVPTWIVPVDTFKIGQEEVRHAHLRIADTSDLEIEMTIGADFFLSHRVYVANAQRKLYFTYNGGPVFDLGAPTLVQEGAAGVAKPSTNLARGEADPADAEGFARRGAARTIRGDHEGAIADFTRAIALAPKEARYLYGRALARLAMQQAFLAMADLDEAVKLEPGYADALILRARLRLAGKDSAGARSDLEAAAAAVGKTSNIRLQIADIWMGLEDYPSAIDQFDHWIAVHPVDSSLGQALNGRCWARALWGQELQAALADCDRALRLAPNSPIVLDSRGLVHLRLGDLDKAIADYDAALALRPKNAWSLYGRGLAKLKKGVKDAKADIAAATAIDPTLSEEAKRHGIGPTS